MFSFKLGAALKMEHTVLEMLGDLEQEAQSTSSGSSSATMPAGRASR